MTLDFRLDNIADHDLYEACYIHIFRTMTTKQNHSCSALPRLFSIVIIVMLCMVGYGNGLYADMKEADQAYDKGDYSKAFSEWNTEAWKGNMLAQYYLGNLYEDGLGTERNLELAAYWYRSAAREGLDLAQFRLGWLHLTGQGIRKDFIESARWFQLSAEQGHEVALYHLGQQYEFGYGVPKDFVKALQLYRQSGNRGFRGAQFTLGIKYDTGDGVAVDKMEAVKWYTMAADQGIAAAQYNLGLVYKENSLWSDNRRIAYLWMLTVAITQQDQDAVGHVAEIENGMTYEQLEHARESIRQCKEMGWLGCSVIYSSIL